MYKFSDKSKEKLLTCHKDIQVIMNEVIKVYDFTVLEGHRTKEKQQEYYAKGLSKLDGVNKKSKHQSSPSMAIDIMPYAKNFNPFTNRKVGEKSFYFLAGLIYSVSERLYKEDKINHKIRWGGNWDGDKYFDDQSFFDLPHFELIKP